MQVPNTANMNLIRNNRRAQVLINVGLRSLAHALPSCYTQTLQCIRRHTYKHPLPVRQLTTSLETPYNASSRVHTRDKISAACDGTLATPQETLTRRNETVNPEGLMQMNRPGKTIIRTPSNYTPS